MFTFYGEKKIIILKKKTKKNKCVIDVDFYLFFQPEVDADRYLVIKSPDTGKVIQLIFHFNSTSPITNLNI